MAAKHGDPRERADAGEAGAGPRRPEPGEGGGDAQPRRSGDAPRGGAPERLPLPVELPEALRAWLGDREGLYLRGVAHLVLTVDEAGYPHPAVVDAVVPAAGGGLRFGLGGASRGLANVRRSGRATLILADAGHLWIVKGSAAELVGALPRGYVGVELRPHEVREDVDPQAAVRTGITFGPVTEEGAREAAAVAAGLEAATAP